MDDGPSRKEAAQGVALEEARRSVRAVSPEEALSRGGLASSQQLERRASVPPFRRTSEDATEGHLSRGEVALGAGDRRERNLPGNVPSRGEATSTDALGGANCHGDQCERNLPGDGGGAAEVGYGEHGGGEDGRERAAAATAGQHTEHFRSQEGAHPT